MTSTDLQYCSNITKQVLALAFFLHHPVSSALRKKKEITEKLQPLQMNTSYHPTHLSDSTLLTSSVWNVNLTITALTESSCGVGSRPPRPLLTKMIHFSIIAMSL